MSSTLRKGWCPGALRPMEAKDGLLVRLRLTGGILPATAALAIANLVERYGSGLLDLTARANLQIRGVSSKSLPALQDGLQALGLLDADTSSETVRNVIASPLAGLHGGINTRPLVAALERRLLDETALHALPGKFGFLIDDGSRPSLENIEADVRFDFDGERFEIALGGTHESALHIGQCDGADLADEAARIAKTFLRAAAGRPDVRRMRDAIAALEEIEVLRIFACVPSPVYGRRWPRRKPRSDEGVPHLASEDERGVNSPHPTLADARATFSRRRKKESVRSLVGFEEFGGARCLGLAAPFGRLDAAMLRAAAEAAACTALGELRLTPFRIILIPGADAVALPGYITDPADPRLAVAACAGAKGCMHGTTDTHADATALAASLAPGADIALHVSGCEKGCAKASATPLTLVARDGRYDLIRNGRASDTPERRRLDLAAVRRVLATELESA